MARSFSKKKVTKKRKSVATRRNVKPPLDVMFIHRCLQAHCKKRVDPTASFVLEGALQYLGAEILEMSYRVAQNRRTSNGKRAGQSVIITAVDIKTAVEYDSELKALIRTEKKEYSKSPANKPKELQLTVDKT
ncbi:hypothetical protein TNCV_3904061 [Trichonephila clavipes]|nr:hypothetical protein TNCV_3904061 [Trichonephila clavipes]